MGKVLATILLLHLVGGFSAATMDFKNPSSQSKATARFIRERGLNKMLIVGHEDMTLPIIWYLRKDRYFITPGEQEEISLQYQLMEIARFEKAIAYRR